MRKPSNPFIITGYHSPAYFCDREEELSWLNEQYINERNIVLYSWRRMGKTALIKHFLYFLKKNFKIDGIFIDLLGTSTLEEANRRIASAIIEQLGDIKKGVAPRLMKLLRSIGATVGFDQLSGTPQITFGLLNAHSISTSLESLGTFLSEQKKPVVICIDEFQRIIDYPEINAEATFRTWMQNFPMIRFIFSGSHRHMMVSMFSEESRPFYRSSQIRSLGPLPSKAYMRFIILQFKKSNKYINDTHLDRIFQWTRMQTYYVQLVCNKLYGRTDNVTDKIIEEVYQEIIQQEVPLFSSFQQLLTNFQWKLLVAISKEEVVENPFSKGFMLKHDLGATSSVRTAVHALINKEFVLYFDKKYFMHDTLFMRWLQKL